MTNGIIDPYYGWHLGVDDFNNHILKKYGSLETAEDKILYYQNNWVDDDTEFTVSFFENNLPVPLKKYYTPEYNNGEKILSYKRKKDNTKVNTNQIINITYGNLANASNVFEVGELLDIFGINSALIGMGEITYVGDSSLKIKNISGNTSTISSTIKGRTSTASSTIVSSTVDMKNIPDDEAVFWSPISFYTYELEINENNKNIKLLDERYAMQISEDLRISLKT
jgi:translation elongation factor P/translation initiation factor 5A